MSSEQRISHLLTREEIELVTRLLGNRCQVLAMGIVQLYLADGPDYSTWRKHDVGVLCLVKDSQRRSYFFRLYCINRKQMVWEHEVYNSLDYESKRPYFHSFEAEEGIAGFNFASEDEANAVKTALLEKLEAKRQRRQERRNRHSTSGMNQHPNPPVPSMPSGDSDIANGSVPVPTKQIQLGISNAGKRRKDSKRRLTKADIGLPKDFRHVSHVGWDPNKGFDLDNVEDPQLKQFLFKAGVSNSQMEDKETREFIYDFINRHGGIDAVKEEVVFPSAAHSQSPSVPPPVPARSAPTSTTSYPYQTRSAPPPPPPPSRTGPLPPPPPPSQPPATTGPPPSIQFRPPQAIPGSLASSPAPPPPPAPPAAFNTPPPPPPPPTFSVSDSSPVIPKTPVAPVVAQPDSRSALMDAIRSGTPLKHVEVESKRSTSGDSRGDLLDQIRQGVELKSVQHKARPASSSTPQNGLAGALARALAERSRVIHSDSSGSSDDDEEEDDEWED